MQYTSNSIYLRGTLNPKPRLHEQEEAEELGPEVPSLQAEACLGGVWRSDLVTLWGIVPLKYIEYGVYGDLVIIYPKPYSIDLPGNIDLNPPKAAQKAIVLHT